MTDVKPVREGRSFSAGRWCGLSLREEVSRRGGSSNLASAPACLRQVSGPTNILIRGMPSGGQEIFPTSPVTGFG